MAKRRKPWPTRSQLSANCILVIVLVDCRRLIWRRLNASSSFNYISSLNKGTMPTLLIQHAELLATLDDADTRWQDGALYIVDNVIQRVGPSGQLPQTADELIDARGMAILPGLV